MRLTSKSAPTIIGFLAFYSYTASHFIKVKETLLRGTISL